MTALHLVKEPDLQADRARLFAKAEEISADLARRGAQLDTGGKPPLEEIDRLKTEGLLTALHPAGIGGRGRLCADDDAPLDHLRRREGE